VETAYLFSGEMSRDQYWERLRAEDRERLSDYILPVLVEGIQASGCKAGVLAVGKATVPGVEYNDVDLKIVAVFPHQAGDITEAIYQSLKGNGIFDLVWEERDKASGLPLGVLVSFDNWDRVSRVGLFDICLLIFTKAGYFEKTAWERRFERAFCELVFPDEIAKEAG
jgi:hypothetical protein